MIKICLVCNTKKNLLPIFNQGTDIGSEDDYSGNYICKKCLKNSEDYMLCDLCNDEGVYHIDDVNGYGGGCYCSEHYQEVIPIDEFEEDGRNDLAEYYSDPAHW